MDIKRTLALRFTGIVALILAISTIAIYALFYKSRTEEFYGRLRSKAELVAQMLIDIDAIDLELLKTIERNNPLNLPKERIVICEPSGNILYSTEDSTVIQLSPVLLKQANTKKELRSVNDDFEIIGIHYSSKGSDILVFAGAVDVYGHNKLYMLRNILLLVFVVCLGVVYWAGHFFAKRALLPIVTIVESVDIGISSLNARLRERDNNDELASLINTFNRMLQRIEEAFTIQKNFIANASHEMRVPLTVISGQVEVALMNERTAQDYKSVLESVLADMRNLNNLSNRLLLLAQTSSDFAQSDFKELRIDDVLWQIQSEITKQKTDFQISINFPENIADEAQLIVWGNELLLRTALYNLMDNACKYSKDKKAQVYMSINPTNIEIVVKDKGIGIPQKDQSFIFEPFYRAANSFNEKGHGIGLSLTQRIIKLHQGKISFTSEEGVGTSFSVVLPLYYSKKI